MRDHLGPWKLSLLGRSGGCPTLLSANHRLALAGHHRRDKPKAEQIFPLDVLQHFLPLDQRRFHRLIRKRTETHSMFAQATLDDTFQTHECTAANEQDIGSIDADVFLLWMFAPTL